MKKGLEGREVAETCLLDHWVRPQGIPQKMHPVLNFLATHSRVLAWRIPWTEEPGGLQPRGSQRVGHDGAAKQQEQHEDRNHFPLPAAIEPGPPSSPPCSWHRADAQ